MKAWDDLIASVRVYTTIKSKYYIDNGVKIERFNDGSFKIKNVMGNSDKFTDITNEQLSIFNDVGWDVGCLNVNIDFLEQRNSFLSYLMTTDGVNKDNVSRRIKKNNEKLLHYQQELVKFVIN
jgi:hypothetical protein